jgi:hypothetical protein
VIKSFIIRYVGPFIEFRQIKVGKCRFELFLVGYLCISLLGVNNCLLSTVNIISEKMYWECSVINSKFLNASLQDSLAPMLDKILTIFFCKINSLLTLEEHIFKMYTGLTDLGYGYIAGCYDYCNKPSNFITKNFLIG